MSISSLQHLLTSVLKFRKPKELLSIRCNGILRVLEKARPVTLLMWPSSLVLTCKMIKMKNYLEFSLKQYQSIYDFISKRRIPHLSGHYILLLSNCPCRLQLYCCLEGGKQDMLPQVEEALQSLKSVFLQRKLENGSVGTEVLVKEGSLRYLERRITSFWT